ncbi:hypothetical protein [Paracidovorax konjaci]|uniref:Uncharacterized protein n=1 Tax=Paracidovorax konjaci TaxID=32040 RepID=A0A1I1XN32_9BURK|nr:hypothetical protein [Paracidovorax konjaci]SFE08736.1 hypothetical protein SAMN04489710_11410 [Paracidovorax konjaci]
MLWHGARRIDGDGDGDGCYWFLHPWFTRVQRTTGRYATVKRAEILRAIDRFQALLDEAKVSRKTLAFRGD